MTMFRLTTRLATRANLARPSVASRPFSITTFRAMDPKNPSGAPLSDSSQEKNMKNSVASDAATPGTNSSETGGSATAKPLTGDNTESGLGQDEHGQDPSKRDPNKPAGQKAKEVENLQQPLDAADK